MTLAIFRVFEVIKWRPRLNLGFNDQGGYRSTTLPLRYKGAKISIYDRAKYIGLRGELKIKNAKLSGNIGVFSEHGKHLTRKEKNVYVCVGKDRNYIPQNIHL